MSQIRANGNSGLEVKNRTHESKESNNSVLWLLTSCIVAVGAIVVANNLLLRSIKDSTENLFSELASSTETTASEDASIKPKVWIAGKRLETGYLRHVMDAFDKLGYVMVNGTEEEWDILWSHEYPFTDTILKYQLQPHQRVNHFPGSGYITNKVSLATSDIKHVPKAFHLPKSKEEFVKFAAAHPEKLWVKKSNDHRGIRIEKADEMDLDSSGTFVQEYIHNPLLIDGKKFDIGIYVVMTSVEPLRVYILDSDVLLRFCAHPYLPFNSSDLDSYVVGDDYTPIWEIPSLKQYFEDTSLNMKQTLTAYLQSIKKDPKKMWANIEEAIASVYLAKEQQISKLTQVVANPRHFFEMVRFDFVVDEDLNIYIMEANMSPNLSSLHFKPNKKLYEQVVFNILSVAGIANTLHVQNWMNRNEDFWNFMVNDKDLSVFDDICSTNECHKSCSKDKCQVCTFCLADELKDVLKDATLEHKSKWNTKRIIPTATRAGTGLHDSLQQRWFQGKCLQDSSWCD